MSYGSYWCPEDEVTFEGDRCPSCGWEPPEEEWIMTVEPPSDQSEHVKRLLWEAVEFAQHDAWRCEHPDRYPPNPDCCCGLLSFRARVKAAIGPAPADFHPPGINFWPHPASVPNPGEGEGQ